MSCTDQISEMENENEMSELQSDRFETGGQLYVNDLELWFGLEDGDNIKCRLLILYPRTEYRYRIQNRIE